MTKVSIIVPVYNVEAYLDRCLASLVNQTLKNIEIIIVNDGSTDNSQIIIDRYAKMDKRIKAFNKKNGGLSDARNYGLPKVTGDYIGFVDADDYVDATMYEKLYQKAIQDNSDLVECNFYWCYPDKTELDIANYHQDKELLMTNVRVVVFNKLYKRDIIKKNGISFPFGLRYEDIYFTYSLLPYVKKLSYVDEGLYNYIQRSGSISNTQNAKVRDIFIIMDLLVEFYKERGLYKKYEQVIEYVNIKLLLGSSFLRILGIDNKKLRNEILRENWLYINNNYPNWHKNTYLRRIKTTKNIYYRFLNSFTYHLSSFIFGLKK